MENAGGEKILNLSDRGAGENAKPPGYQVNQVRKITRLLFSTLKYRPEHQWRKIPETQPFPLHLCLFKVPRPQILPEGWDGDGE